ncbi:MAG: DivIVA domain-containing protein [Desulfuromonadales bacterium]|nr:DivIVA domain-containing protein [Desulfuromonadales bacterium]
MTISPIDIQQQRFRRRAFGYDKESVDQFLETLMVEMERLIRQNNDLQEELARARHRVCEMQQQEAGLKNALMTTQKMTDQLKASARSEAEAMMAHAELRAERLLRKAEERRLEMIAEIQELQRQKIDFDTSLRALLEKHVRMLDSDRPTIAASIRAAPSSTASRAGLQQNGSGGDDAVLDLTYDLHSDLIDPGEDKLR